MQQISERPPAVNFSPKLTWRHTPHGWILFANRRRRGHVVPDPKHPGMWRAELASGRLSDMANLTWAKGLAFEAAARELEWEASRQAAYAPSKSQEKRAVFESIASLVRQNGAGAPTLWAEAAE